MRKTFKCNICGETLSLTGSPKAIQGAYALWMTGHKHDNVSDTTIGTDDGYTVGEVLAPGLFRTESRHAFRRTFSMPSEAEPQE